MDTEVALALALAVASVVAEPPIDEKSCLSCFHHRQNTFCKAEPLTNTDIDSPEETERGPGQESSLTQTLRTDTRQRNITEGRVSLAYSSRGFIKAGKAQEQEARAGSLRNHIFNDKPTAAEVNANRAGHGLTQTAPANSTTEEHVPTYLSLQRHSHSNCIHS